MSNYTRQPNDQIYADLAFRLGKVIVQYQKLDKNEESYEVTLHLTILQNLLAIATEQIRIHKDSPAIKLFFNQNIGTAEWGLEEDCWISYTFNRKRTLQNFIYAARNAMSHPTNVDSKSDYPTTGYTTEPTFSNYIEKILFINSPDTSKNRPKAYDLNELEKLIYSKVKEKKIIKEIPEGVCPGPHPDFPEKFCMFKDGKPFVRVSIIELTVPQLKSFVVKLSNYLAQPIKENWDGVTIENLLAA